MRLYTVVAEWREGTCVRQVVAKDEAPAMSCWLQQLEAQLIKGLGPVARRKLAGIIKKGEMLPVPLDGL